MFAFLTTRRRWGLVFASMGVALYATHDRAMALVAGTAGVRAMGTTIGLLLPALLVAGGYLLASPAPAARGDEKGAKRKANPRSDRE